MTGPTKLKNIVLFLELSKERKTTSSLVYLSVTLYAIIKHPSFQSRNDSERCTFEALQDNAKRFYYHNCIDT